MENTLYIALSYQTVMQRQMEVLANNIANVSTPGFKSEQMMFVEHLQDVLAEDDVSFVQDIAVVRDFREGGFTRTSEPLDVAITGKGWFVIDTPAGMRYSRNGHFQRDANGEIVTSSGYPVLGDNNRPISLPQNAADLVVAPDGTVSADGQIAGRIKLVAFANEQELRKEADSLYSTDAPSLPAGTARLRQGMIEESNVKAIVEVTNMMTAVREFQMAQKVIEEEHQRQLEAINTLTEPPAA
jgi:flagellar basal-body rod protein FlgF